MYRFGTHFLFFIALLFSTTAAAYDATRHTDARWAALEFLQLADESEFDLAWQRTSLVTQSYSLPPEWFRRLRAVRPHLGPALSRDLKTVSSHHTWTALPDGEYRRLSFAVTFLNKQEALETVLLVRQGDGWQVAAYYLR